jgi:adenine phosphoribosyltransferase
LELSIPFSVVRKRGYGLPGEVNVNQVTGYSKGDMFINGITKGERVVVIDDIISTGGTLRAIIKALLSMEVELVDVIAIVEKSGGKGQLEKELGICIKTLVKVEVRDGRVYVN